MSKVQEYLRNKRIKELGYPKMYTVESSREGVKSPIERQVIEISDGEFIISSEGKIPSKRYKFEDSFPLSVDIQEGKNSSKEEGYGSGFGDLWGWTYYSTFSKEDAEKYYEEESERVRQKYQK